MKQLVDLSHKLNKDAELSILTLDSDEGLQVLRHTSAHVLAQAVKRLYGNVELGMGPVMEDGFYYDFKLEHPLSSEDLQAIEKEMEHIISENLEIKRIEVTYEEAVKLFEGRGESFKLDIAKNIPNGEKLTLYHTGGIHRSLQRAASSIHIICKIIQIDSCIWCLLAGRQSK